MKPAEILARFDRYLAAAGERLVAVVIGGTALNLLDVIDRPTRDVDVLYPRLSSEIADAARSFAATMRSEGEILRDDWLNDGPAELAAALPDGWQHRLRLVFSGEAIELRTLGRADLLRTKLFALCDRGEDLDDCIALAPTAREMEDARPWVEQQDANELWPDHVRRTLDDLARRIVDAV